MRLGSGKSQVNVLFVPFILIYLSRALVITCLARCLDRSGSILFIVLWDIAHAVFLQLLACKEPPYDGVEAQ
jgi:hypothetical protein